MANDIIKPRWWGIRRNLLNIIPVNSYNFFKALNINRKHSRNHFIFNSFIVSA